MDHTLSYYSTLFYREFSAYTAARLKELGVSYGSLYFILYVGAHPGCTQAQLTSALKLDWGHSQRTVGRLKDEGFVTKEASGTDKRSHCLNLTGAGQEAFLVCRQVFEDWDRERLSALSVQEKEMLFGLLEKLERRRG